MRRVLLTTLATACLFLHVPSFAEAQHPSKSGSQATRRVIVRLLPGDACQVGKTPLKMSELPFALRVLAGLPEKPLIAIEADKETLYGRVVQALDACHEAGLEEVTFVVPPAQEGQ